MTQGKVGAGFSSQIQISTSSQTPPSGTLERRQPVGFNTSPNVPPESNWLAASSLPESLGRGD